MYGQQSQSGLPPAVYNKCLKEVACIKQPCPKKLDNACVKLELKRWNLSQQAKKTKEKEIIPCGGKCGSEKEGLSKWTDILGREFSIQTLLIAGGLIVGAIYFIKYKKTKRGSLR